MQADRIAYYDQGSYEVVPGGGGRKRKQRCTHPFEELEQKISGPDAKNPNRAYLRCPVCLDNDDQPGQWIGWLDQYNKRPATTSSNSESPIKKQKPSVLVSVSDIELLLQKVQEGLVKMEAMMQLLGEEKKTPQ